MGFQIGKEREREREREISLDINYKSSINASSVQNVEKTSLVKNHAMRCQGERGLERREGEREC